MTEKPRIDLLDHVIIVNKLQNRIEKLEEHKNRQIDENRKINRKVDELEYKTDFIMKRCKIMVDNINANFYTIQRVMNENGEAEEDEEPPFCRTCGGNHG